jgi:hypothetical protein
MADRGTFAQSEQTLKTRPAAPKMPLCPGADPLSAGGETSGISTSWRGILAH